MARTAKKYVMTVMFVLLPLTLISGRPLSAFQQDEAQQKAAAEDTRIRAQRLLAASQFRSGRLALERRSDRRSTQLVSAVLPEFTGGQPVADECPERHRS